MKVEEVKACSFNSWYEKFKKCTIKSVVVPLPVEVIRYLQDDGTIVLPEGSLPPSSSSSNKNDYDDDDYDDDDFEDWEHCTTTERTAEAPNLDAFNKHLTSLIKGLGGKVFPKLNWSSPKDASWIGLNNCLQCVGPGDVYLLLKSSDFVAHDLTTPFKDCDDITDGCEINQDYCLVLRQWTDINPSAEFRCYVRNKELIGVCQRDPSQHYSCIANDKTNILSDILTFWKEKIQNFFPLLSYVFDVYRPYKDKVVLVDFGPYGRTTDGLLFSWDELLEEHNVSDKPFEPDLNDVEEWVERVSTVVTECLNRVSLEDSNKLVEEIELSPTQHQPSEPEFRIVADETGVQPSPYMQYGIPTDIIDLSTGQDPYKLVDFLKMQHKVQNQCVEDDSDDEAG